MPRLTTQDYLRQRAALREEWLVREGYAFALLSTADQFYLHDYFEPAKRLSPLEATAHRKTISKSRRSLPQQAGRAFARIRPFLNLPTPSSRHEAELRVTHNRSGPNGHQVSVFGQVNPELDPKAFAKILLELAQSGPPPDTSTSRAQRGSRRHGREAQK